MTVTIEHVRHRVTETRYTDHKGHVLRFTGCGLRFVPAHPESNRRDIDHHEPATSRCGACR